MGRAPSSGYCANCRARRVKCDKTLPHCQRCLKAGRQCGGYDTGLRMQNQVLIKGRDGRKKMATLHAVSHRSSTASPPPAAHAVTVAAPLTLHVSLTNADLSFSYFFQNFPFAHFWRPIMGLHEGPGQAVYQASLAIATGYKALQTNDKILKAEAISTYGNSVRLLRDRLSHTLSSKLNMARLAPTAIMLSLFTFTTDGRVNLVNYNGLQSILKFCGPATFQDEPLLNIFRSCRACLLCRSLDLGVSIFLQWPEWNTIPWAKHPKTLHDKLHDIASQLPSITQALKDMSSLSWKETLFLLGQLDELSGRLNGWRWEWEQANPLAATSHTALPGHETSRITDPRLARLLSSRITFQDVSQAVEINLYNTLRLYTSRQRQILMGDARKLQHGQALSRDELDLLETYHLRQQRPSPLMLPGEARLPLQYAIEAARLIPYLSEQLPFRRDSVPMMVSPTWVTLSALSSQPEIRDWTSWLRSQIVFFRDRPKEVYDIFDVESPKLRV